MFAIFSFFDRSIEKIQVFKQICQVKIEKSSQNSQNLLKNRQFSAEKLRNFLEIFKNCALGGQKFRFSRHLFKMPPVTFCYQKIGHRLPIRVKMPPCGEDPGTPLFLRHRDKIAIYVPELVGVPPVAKILGSH